jgi:hypothetical protein
MALKGSPVRRREACLPFLAMETRAWGMTFVAEECPRAQFLCAAPDASNDVDAEDGEWDVDIQVALEGASGAEERDRA